MSQFELLKKVVYELQKDILDISYITLWANTLGLTDLFEKLRRDVDF